MFFCFYISNFVLRLAKESYDAFDRLLFIDCPTRSLKAVLLRNGKDLEILQIP